jgi:HSP20 family protein
MAMSPFRRGRGFYDLHSEMNRLFDETYGGLSRWPGGQQRPQQLTEWAPAVDVLQREGDLVVRAELPGVRPEDVDITLENRVLTIRGERREEQEEQRGGYYVRERRHGSFRRSMTLPEGVDEDRVRARYENGVLEVTIEGAAAAREPRRIQVETDESRAGTEGLSVEGARRQPERKREEDKGLLDRAKEAILDEEEEPRRREGTDRPEERR